MWAGIEIRSLRADWSIALKRELNLNVKLLILWSIYTPTLTHGHELCVVTNEKKKQVQAEEMSFL